MDIPNTGAIFTLGKSHLAENTQSYFYIKNDPIKRLIAGPFQSAVICDSGRLFVWGENYHGQLGIGGHHSSNNNNNNISNGDIILKPTCVKSLKSLGLKIADISFGNDWSIILTLSNELFFTGRNIFASDCTVSTNFTEATVNKELCEIIRKPFRLEEFDDCLSKSEEAENFTNVFAGNEHFVLLTSFGRLIGWGSNQFHQLGTSKDDEILTPREIVLDAPVQQYTCGPESTLVLTENGKLYLTGRLNEFLFPDFTELQKNLSSNEKIMFINISKASEIFIVTNTGSIYRSYESLRNKSLIFQRFYDYDSEENGPIWKLLKGTSFYAVLTKANKFYTTFSESGHHLKTFREISKFKNLRILDMALGDKHILVHGIPKSSTMAATIGPEGEHRHMAQSVLRANTTAGILNMISNGKNMVLSETEINLKNPKTNTPVLFTKEMEKTIQSEENVQEKDSNFVGSLTSNELSIKENIDIENLDLNHNGSFKESEESIESFESENTVLNNKSPTRSLKSQKSCISSVKQETEATTLSVKSLRPSTPFPESSPRDSSPWIVKKTPKRNFSYEAAINNEFVKQTSSPSFAQSLENIPDLEAKESADFPGLTLSTPTPPTEEDEELRLEISETTDPLDHTVTVNEIRFINNGIDVTANVKKLKSGGSEDSLDVTDEEEEENKTDDDIDKNLGIRTQAKIFIEELEDEIDKKVGAAKAYQQEEEILFKSTSKGFTEKFGFELSQTKDLIEHEVKEAVGSTDSKLTVAKETNSAAMEAEIEKAPKGDKYKMENMDNIMVRTSEEPHQVMYQMGNNVGKANEETKDAMNNALRKIAGDTKHVAGTVTSKISNEIQDARNSISSMLKVKKNKVDIQKPIEPIQHEAVFQSEGISNTTLQLNSNNTGVQEDDERTTASANSNHTASAGNPYDSTDPFDPELDAMVQRGKQALLEELQAASVVAENKPGRIVVDVVEERSKFYKFLDDMREKSKSLSCRNEKSFKIIEDQPPRYSVEDQEAVQPVNSHANSSKVCAIL